MATKREIYSRKFLFPILRAALQLHCQGVHWQSTLISDDRPFSSIKNQLQVNLFLVYLQCRTDSVKKKLKEERLQCRRCNRGSSFKICMVKRLKIKNILSGLAHVSVCSTNLQRRLTTCCLRFVTQTPPTMKEGFFLACLSM